MKNSVKIIATLLIGSTLVGCADMNNAQYGTLIGTGAGALVGRGLGKALCNGDAACTNRLTLAGSLAGAYIGYKTGYEKDLEIAQKMESELKNHGYSPVLTTEIVETSVPIDIRNGAEIANDQVQNVPQQYIKPKLKQVKKFKTISVALKNKNDATERAQMSKYLIENGNLMAGSNERKILTVPVATSAEDKNQLASLTMLARQQNMVVKEDRRTTTYTLASL